MFAILLVVACGGSGSKPDAAIDAFDSICGKPGDMGNELGIGKFCLNQSSGECATTANAPLCSSLGNAMTHFCTKTCTMGSTDQCGTATTCTCQGSSCGCTPTSCLM